MFKIFYPEENTQKSTWLITKQLQTVQKVLHGRLKEYFNNIHK